MLDLGHRLKSFREKRNSGLVPVLGGFHHIPKLIFNEDTNNLNLPESLPHQVLAGHGTLLLLNLVPELVVTFITHLID